ncbi:hypothetical protein GFB56_07825 [Ensifer sp. T173]|uniref:Uncharacterized protein n=1 Tax=Ensifer canadensis TaxID=555315 RepID=A0AAW4FI34_9HYPH|nr:hypothetical protein [Ensifer canadensis]
MRRVFSFGGDRWRRDARPSPTCHRPALLHVSLNRLRFKDKNMQQFKVLQQPLRI